MFRSGRRRSRSHGSFRGGLMGRKKGNPRPGQIGRYLIEVAKGNTQPWLACKPQPPYQPKSSPATGLAKTMLAFRLCHLLVKSAQSLLARFPLEDTVQVSLFGVAVMFVNPARKQATAEQASSMSPTLRPRLFATAGLHQPASARFLTHSPRRREDGSASRSNRTEMFVLQPHDISLIPPSVN